MAKHVIMEMPGVQAVRRFRLSDGTVGLHLVVQDGMLGALASVLRVGGVTPAAVIWYSGMGVAGVAAKWRKAGRMIHEFFGVPRPRALDIPEDEDYEPTVVIRRPRR